MKKTILALVTLTMLVSSCASQSSGSMNSLKDSTAYAIGVFIGENTKMSALQGGSEPNIDIIAEAVKDVYNKKEDKIQDAYLYLNAIQIAANAYQVDSTFDIATIINGIKETINDENVIKGENANQYIIQYITSKANDEQDSYLAEVDKIDGIQKTESGIRYIIDNPGEGKITENDKVSVNYTLFDYQNDTIDSSITAGQPLEVQLPGGVVPGFAESLQLVGVGGKLTVWIPSQLGYGESGAGRAIRPNQALKFDIEIVEKLPVEK